MTGETQEREYITEKEAKMVKKLFKKNLKSYKEKDASVSDEEWLEQLFQVELTGIISDEEAKQDAREIAVAIKEYDENLASLNKAAENGISKECWLADKISLASSTAAVNEYGQQVLQSMDNELFQKNAEIAEALRRSSDGHIMMSPNLDGNIAEHMIAKTTELDAYLQGKNVKVEVRNAHTANSVDVRATNLDTGKYQNYQLKFGKDAQATIELIERGNYTNQRIVVPTEQLEEVQEYFRAKGSEKTITDHIDAFGVEGGKLTKENAKELQMIAQRDDASPELDYNHYQTKNLALNIGKNAVLMGLMSAAVTTGWNVVRNVFKGESMEPDELVEKAIKTGADTSIKAVAAGTMQVAVRKGIIRCIPKGTPAGIIANVACVGIENVKILAKVASGELSITKGIDQMGRTTVSMTGGILGAAVGAAEAAAAGTAAGAALAAWIPVAGPVLGAAAGFVGGTVGYFAGSKLMDTLYSAEKKVAETAKSMAKTAWEGMKKAGRRIAGVLKVSDRRVFG